MTNSNLAAFVQATTPAPIVFLRPSPALKQNEVVFSLSSLWKFYDCPFGFPVVIIHQGRPLQVHYTPFLSALELYGKDRSPEPMLRFVAKQAPDVRPPLLDQIGLLAVDSPFLLSANSGDFDLDRSWYSIAWYPILNDPAIISLVRGFMLTYHHFRIASPPSANLPVCAWNPAPYRSPSGSPATSRPGSPTPHHRSRSSSVISELGEPDLETRYTLTPDAAKKGRLVVDPDHTIGGYRCQTCQPSIFPTRPHEVAAYHVARRTHSRYAGLPEQACNYPLGQDMTSQLHELCPEVFGDPAPDPAPLGAGAVGGEINPEAMTAFNVFGQLTEPGRTMDEILTYEWRDTVVRLAHPGQIPAMLSQPQVAVSTNEGSEGDVSGEPETPPRARGSETGDIQFVTAPDGNTALRLPPSVPYEKVPSELQKAIEKKVQPGVRTIVSSVQRMNQGLRQGRAEKKMRREQEKELKDVLQQTLRVDDRSRLDIITRPFRGRTKRSDGARSRLIDTPPPEPETTYYSTPSSPDGTHGVLDRTMSDREREATETEDTTDDDGEAHVEEDRQTWAVLGDMVHRPVRCQRNLIHTIGLVPYKIRNDIWMADVGKHRWLTAALSGRHAVLDEGSMSTHYVTAFLEQNGIDHPDLTHCKRYGLVLPQLPMPTQYPRFIPSKGKDKSFMHPTRGGGGGDRRQKKRRGGGGSRGKGSSESDDWRARNGGSGSGSGSGSRSRKVRHTAPPQG